MYLKESSNDAKKAYLKPNDAIEYTYLFSKQLAMNDDIAVMVTLILFRNMHMEIMNHFLLYTLLWFIYIYLRICGTSLKCSKIRFEMLNIMATSVLVTVVTAPKIRPSFHFWKTYFYPTLWALVQVPIRRTYMVEKSNTLNDLYFWFQLLLIFLLWAVFQTNISMSSCKFFVVLLRRHRQ